MNSDGSFEPVDDYKESPRVIVNNRRAGWAPAALAVGLVALAGFSFYQYSQMNNLRQQLTDSQDKTTADVQSHWLRRTQRSKGP
jgi:hypothetical protein